MATTTNYGWETPDDTDLVKDGAAAIRTLGSSIDTTTKNLNPSTTLGDIEYRSATANTNTRLGIGTTGQVLTVSGGVPVWAAVAAGGMTQLATGTLSGSSVSLTSISASYKNLQLIVRDYLPATDGATLRLRFNTDSNANRHRTLNSSLTLNDQAFDSTSIGVTNTQDNGVAEGLTIIDVYDYANTTTWKMLISNAITVSETTTTSFNTTRALGAYNQTGAITAIDLFPSSGNFTSGTYVLYGVS